MTKFRTLPLLKITIVTTLVFLMAGASTAMAICHPFFPPNRTFIPENTMHTFIHYDNGREDMVVQRAFEGNVDDFGLIVAVPSRPTINEASSTIFQDLEEITNPVVPFAPMMMEADMTLATGGERMNGARVLERKNVGDYTSTLIAANNVAALTEWLDGYGYAYTQDDVSNFQYYINQSGTYYFVALQINTDVVNISANGMFWGRLQPLEISFQTHAPIAPIRIMRGDMDQMSLTLFTLSDRMLYIPGVTVDYSQRLNKNDLPSELVINCVVAPCPSDRYWPDDYDANGKWLTRQMVRVNPRAIQSDVILSTGNSSMTVTPGNPRTFNAHLLPAHNGILPGGGATRDYNNLLSSTRLLRWGVKGDDVADLQQFVNDTTGSNLVVDGNWGPLTNAAVKQFQARYNLKVDGIVGPQTRGEIGRGLFRQVVVTQ